MSHWIGKEDIGINGEEEVGEGESCEFQSFLTQADDVLKPGVGEYWTMHYRLRSIKRGQFRFSNFASHFKQKSYFHFLIHQFLLEFL